MLKLLIAATLLFAAFGFGQEFNVLPDLSQQIKDPADLPYLAHPQKNFDKPAAGQTYQQVWATLGTADGVDHLSRKNLGHFDWYYYVPGTHDKWRVRFNGFKITGVTTLDARKDQKEIARRLHEGEPPKWLLIAAAVALL